MLEPKKIKNEQELCKEDFRQVWDSASMGFSAHNDNMPKDEQTALLNEILMDTASATDSDIWNGDATNTGEFDGFTTLFAADASVIKANNGIVPTGVAITKANVISEIEKALLRIKDETYGFCLDTAEPIGLKRLMARPVAKYTIAAQEKHEKNEKVYADD